MKLYKIFILIMILAFGVSCAKKAAEIEITPGTPLWEISKKYSYAYERSRSRGERLTLAEKGMEAGEKCIAENKKDPACYYYHAINTGYYYQSKVVGYQKGLKRMVEDCHNVIKLDPKYASGGGYRMLGVIYTEVPSFTLKSEGIIRDLDKAVSYLTKATEIAPDYPENYIAFSKAYIKSDMREQAAIAIIKAKELLPDWKGHDDYMLWKDDIKKISKKLGPEIKSLQLSKRTNMDMGQIE